MDSYGQFCPVAVASEVFAQRWTPLILRELLAGAVHFNEMRRCLPLIPRSTLIGRLRMLEHAGVITSEHQGSGRPTAYRLTSAGHGFRSVIEGLGVWGQQSPQRFEAHNLDAELLMWNLRRRLDIEQLPPAATNVHVEFTGVPPRYRRARVFWLLIKRPEAELCLKDPGVEVDLFVHADLATFARVWLGDERLDTAQADGRVRLVGPRALVAAFPRWLLLSHFAAHGSVGPSTH